MKSLLLILMSLMSLNFLQIYASFPSLEEIQKSRELIAKSDPDFDEAIKQLRVNPNDQATEEPKFDLRTLKICTDAELYLIFGLNQSNQKPPIIIETFYSPNLTNDNVRAIWKQMKENKATEATSIAKFYKIIEVPIPDAPPAPFPKLIQ